MMEVLLNVELIILEIPAKLREDKSFLLATDSLPIRKAKGLAT